MNMKEIKGLPTLDENAVVKIWRMNFGFRSDLQDSSTTVTVDSQGRRSTEVSTKKLMINTLVYGIFAAECIGMHPITDKEIAYGLSDATINERIKVVRAMDKYLADKLAEEISNFQVDVIETEPDVTADVVKKE